MVLRTGALYLPLYCIPLYNIGVAIFTIGYKQSNLIQRLI